MTITLCFLIMVGIKFGSPNDDYENFADREVARNPYGCLLNIICIFGGTIACLIAAIYYSVTEHWWIFLLFIPGFILAGLVKIIICKIIPFQKITDLKYGPNIAQVVAKKTFGALLVIIAFVLYIILK